LQSFSNVTSSYDELNPKWLYLISSTMDRVERSSLTDGRRDREEENVKPTPCPPASLANLGNSFSSSFKHSVFYKDHSLGGVLHCSGRGSLSLISVSMVLGCTSTIASSMVNFSILA
jgi:hypothetical protein